MGELDRREALQLFGVGLLAALHPGGFELVSRMSRRAPGASLLRALEREVRGPLYTRSEPGFGGAAEVYNSRYDDVRPLAVLRAAGARDVQAAVQWAAKNDVPVAARSGGHSYAGYSTVRNGLVIDLRSLDRVTVSSGSRSVRIGPGARLIEVYAGLAAKGLAVPGGTCPTVGFGGLALGGGYGFASRALGMTCDTIESMRVVTAGGSLLTADEDTNADLFWALRGGGGGNFGIVTRFTVNASREGSAAFYSASWPAGATEDAIAAWQGL
ncbi:MAG: FAD-dependent oxidoreductase, partial [Thermoleophilaceae bacterium]|nr:FAD-dependent oxidoreductase [Thermoleophilaceae bacterium]